MKLQCDLCREIVVADFVVASGGLAIEVRCPACAQTFTVAARAPERASASASTSLEIDGPAMTCPKCGLLQPEAAACRACGLKADRMADFERTADVAPPDVMAAWTACEAAWPSAAAHERLAQAAAAHHAYAWTARRYRDHARAHPDDPLAAEHLARLTRITEATLRATASAKKDKLPGAPAGKPYRGVIVILVALVLFAAVGTIYALVTTSSHESGAGPAAPIPVTPQAHPPR